MSLTITIPGAVNVTTGAMAPAVLTIGVGVPGAAGPAGPAGPGVPVGGTAGQFLTKIDGTNYNTDWTTVNLSAYAVKANNLSDLTNFATARDNLNLGTLNSPTFAGLAVQGAGANLANLGPTYLTLNHTGYGQFTIQPSTGITFPDATIQTTAYPGPVGATTWGSIVGTLSNQTDLQTALDGKYSTTNPSGFQTAAQVSTALSPYLTSATAASTYQTLAGMSSYLTTATAASTYAVIAAGQPTAGTTGQVLTKNSGTNYDSSWQTLIPGDRYLTTSTTSNTVSNGNKTFTIGTGLSYTPTQNITISYDASNHMHGEVLTYNSGTGVLTVDVNHHTGSGTYTAWVVNVGGVTPATSVAWGAITGTLSAQTDLQSALDAKLAVTTAASTYAPIASPTFTGTVTIPAGASISGFASLASPDFTGNVTINSSTGSALFITQTGTGNILTLYDQASDTTFVAIDANGKVSTIASETTNGAGFNVPHGAAPTTPVNGDIWTTTTGLFARINGGTQQYAPLGSNNTFSNASSTYGSSTAAGTLNFGTGATISGATKAINIGTNGVSGSTTNTTIGPVLGASTTSIGNTTAASTLNLATGATLTATTKAVNIGTSGVAGSTTNITIGSTTGTSTTTLQGATNGVTQTAGNSTTLLATTAFVTTADNLKANLASPTFTGTPTLPTGTIATTQTAGNNTTAVATTAFVTAAVPAIATFAESQQLTSTTAVMSPFDTITAMMTEGYRPALGMTGGSSGTGAGVNPIMPQYIGIGGPNSGVAGSCHAITNTAGGYITGVDPVSIKFNKPIWLSGSFRLNIAGDSNNDFKAYLGTSMLNGNDPTGPSIGWYRQGGASMPISLMVHNGTTLTKVASASSYGSGSTAVIRYMVYSDGAGNVTLYINGTSVATTALGPTGSTTAATAQFTASTSSTASSTARVYFDLYHPKIFIAPQ